MLVNKPYPPRTDDGREWLRGAIGPTLAMVGLLVCWEMAVRLLAVPAYILPPPSRIGAVLAADPGTYLSHTGITALEMVLGFVGGSLLGSAAALAMAGSTLLRGLLAPVMVVSQALPVFAIAPLLVIWFGFGLASKVAMAALIIFFPVATALFEGLRRTDPGLIDLAVLSRARPFDTLVLLRLPAALPFLASGLRVGAGVAPIGAIVGEWVGASAGLGFIMIQANARMQTDAVFAALAALVACALILYIAVDQVLARLIHWAPETLPLR